MALDLAAVRRRRAGPARRAAQSSAVAPDRERDRRGREEVRDLVRARHRQGDRRLARRRREAEAAAVGLGDDVLRRDVGGRRAAEPHDRGPRCRAASAATRGSSALATKMPSGLQALEDLGLGRRAIASSEAKNSQVRGGDERDRRDVGLEGRARAVESSPGARHPHLAHHPLGRARQVDDRHRESDRLFWLPGVFSTAKRRARIAAANSLVVVLPTEPVIGGQAEAHLLLQRAAPRRSSASHGSSARAPPESPPAGPRRGARAEQRPGARARPPRARSRGRPRARRGARRRDRPARTLRESTATPERRRGAGRRERRAAAATSARVKFTARPASSGGDLAVVEGSLLASPMTCVVSWPLPAITTTVPGLASSIAARIASRAVRDLQVLRRARGRRAPPRPPRGSPRGPRSADCRRSRSAMSASRPAISPIGARLPRSRSPPHPKTRRIFRSVSSRTAASSRSSASGVCA